VKINQYCSVCKQHMDMEVIPTDDAGDDGVIWLRCPQCQGFLPKFSAEGRVTDAAADHASSEVGSSDTRPETEEAEQRASDGELSPTPSRVTTSADRDSAEVPPVDDDVKADEDRQDQESVAEDVPVDTVAEYAEALAAADLSRARPYRATETYDIGDVIHHLAYGDVGVVVAKDKLPGGRRAVKVFFEETGVVHLIEQSPSDGR
jgi:hypothetical protein